jgi:hypothetical protein
MSTITSTSMLRGLELLRNPHFNRGTAFTAEERAALPRGRERLWLWAFSLVGYGERITLPLLIWLGGVVLAGLSYATVVGIPYDIASLQFADLLVRLALGPLAILRIDDLRPPNAPGPFDLDPRLDPRNRVLGLLPSGDPQGHPGRTLTSRQLHSVGFSPRCLMSQSDVG